MVHYQGEDIEFALSLIKLSQNDMQSWSEAQRIVAYFYTHTNHIAKFSSLNESGYGNLVVSSPTQLTGVIRSADTRVMSGDLYVDIYIYPTNGDIEQIRHFQTGINIISTPIKQETKL